MYLFYATLISQQQWRFAMSTIAFTLRCRVCGVSVRGAPSESHRMEIRVPRNRDFITGHALRDDDSAWFIHPLKRGVWPTHPELGGLGGPAKYRSAMTGAS
jgi:hypothetical protein